MLSFDWSPAYEKSTTKGTGRSSIDDIIRQMSRGVAQRMSREHNWSWRTDKDDGTHRPGKTSIALREDGAPAVSDPEEGAVYVDDDGSGAVQVMIWHNGAWESFSNTEHGNLAGLGEDDHPYVLHTGDVDLPNVDLDMGGHRLTVTGPVNGALKVYPHVYEAHEVGPDAIPDNHISSSKRVSHSNMVNDERGISAGAIHVYQLPGNLRAITGISFYGHPNLRLGAVVASENLGNHLAVYNKSTIVTRFYRLVITGIGIVG